MENLVESIEARGVSERLGYDVLNPEKIHEYWLGVVDGITGFGVKYDELRSVIDGEVVGIDYERLVFLDQFLANYMVFLHDKLAKQIDYMRSLLTSVSREFEFRNVQEAFKGLVDSMKQHGVPEFFFQLFEAFRCLLAKNCFFPGSDEVKAYFCELNDLLMRYLSMESERSIMRPLIEQTQKVLDVYFQRRSVGSKVTEVLRMK